MFWWRNWKWDWGRSAEDIVLELINLSSSRNIISTMIIRRAMIRQGTVKSQSLCSSITDFAGRRFAAPPLRSWTRSLATEVDLEDVESSLDNSLRQTQSLESQIQEKTIQVVPQIDARTHASQNLVTDGTPQTYREHRRRRM